jgi:hypothetical protein
MYGTMWAFDMRFDTRFFAIASCMLNYLEYSLIEFGVAIRNLVNYLTAVKRIQVCLKTFFSNYSIEMKRIFFQTFLLLEESQRDRRLLSIANELEFDGSLSTHKTNIEENNIDQMSIKKVSKVECNLQQAYWQEVKIFSFSFFFLKSLHIDIGWIIFSQ